jgi:rsbT co-antagonist protein RsbR
MSTRSKIINIVSTCQEDLLKAWVKEQLTATTLRADLLSEQELREQSREFLDLFRKALEAGNVTDITAAPWSEARAFLANLSRSRAQKGFSPTETATFIFSLKQPVFARLQAELAKSAETLAEEIWITTSLLDKLGLFTVEVFLRSRQEIISRQQQEMLELSRRW